MESFSKFHMIEREHAKHVTEKVELVYKHASNVKEKDVLFKCIKWDQGCISKFKRPVTFVEEKARQ
jgi:hypothetical protein